MLEIDPTIRTVPSEAADFAVAGNDHEVCSVDELMPALAEPGQSSILVRKTITGLAALRLGPGKALVGLSNVALEFAPGQDGVRLTTDNAILSLRLSTDTHRRAIWNDADVETLGSLSLRHLTVRGAIRLLAEARSGAVTSRSMACTSTKRICEDSTSARPASASR